MKVSSKQISSMRIPKHDEKVRRVLKKIGFVSGEQIAKTLQGGIWRATYSDQSMAVVKVTNKTLHKHSEAIIDGRIIQIDENILKEQNILKYLSAQKNFPKSITKFKKFVESNTDYYLVMEDGGFSLFDFIKNAHQLIKAGQIEISHWQSVVQIILKQMIECIEFIHSHNICHNDISLENFLINDVEVDVLQNKHNTNVRFITDDIQIKLCDFGLAEIFANGDCKSNKWVGKKQYKSPEVISKNEIYDAKKNDIWCLGICVFMMTVGHPPFRAAEEREDAFKYIINGYMIQVLKGWNILHYFSEELIHLFQQVFKYETERSSLSKIKKQLYGISL